MRLTDTGGGRGGAETGTRGKKMKKEDEQEQKRWTGVCANSSEKEKRWVEAREAKASSPPHCKFYYLLYPCGRLIMFTLLRI